MDVFIYEFREKKIYIFGLLENLMYIILLMLDFLVILFIQNINESKI